MFIFIIQEFHVLILYFFIYIKIANGIFSVWLKRTGKKLYLLF